MDVKDITIGPQNSIKDALQLLDKTGAGTLFVTDEDNVILGIITDGDIRRALLNDALLDSKIRIVMNRNFISLPIGTENSIVLNKITDSVKIIPLVDAENRLIDFASINKIRRISVASPVLTGNELAYVTDCIKTNWISSQGKYVRQFEEMFTAYHRGNKSLAVSNGTVALHLALEALGVGIGDEVIVPDLTFAASVNAILYTGATPVLVDIDPYTWNIDVDKAVKAVTTRTKAIMPVHLYGHPCDMDKIDALAKKHNLLIVEDCAEALGSYYKDQPVGMFGDASTFSFFGNKTITTGEGGMIVFKDADVAEKAAMLRDHGMQKNRRYWHAAVGYNYRLTNLQAAIGVAQFERLDEFVSAKRKIAKTYNETLGSFPYFQIPAEKLGTTNSYWLYTCMVRPNSPFTRDDLINYLNQHGIETRPVFFPMHIMPPYINFGQASTLQTSLNVSKCGISLPTSVSLTEIELTYICKTISTFVASFN